MLLYLNLGAELVAQRPHLSVHIFYDVISCSGLPTFA
ncbi:hypothetical protein RRG08_020795 [Elysia crispata]|uniref:Uncharacterized protein n=1 Tax=Elysia crispata TaxID=231223 RepID=A0AAE1DM71_9GAST|nr:hypothetical protein RRG08_020795 [Elysia crispata]